MGAVPCSQRLALSPGVTRQRSSRPPPPRLLQDVQKISRRKIACSDLGRREANVCFEGPGIINKESRRSHHKPLAPPAVAHQEDPAHNNVCESRRSVRCNPGSKLPIGNKTKHKDFFFSTDKRDASWLGPSQAPPPIHIFSSLGPMYKVDTNIPEDPSFPSSSLHNPVSSPFLVLFALQYIPHFPLCTGLGVERCTTLEGRE